jgi:hypothetical protein
MKLSFLGSAVAALCLGTLPCTAQTAPPQQNQPPQGKVIFSRSMDENGQVTTQAAQTAAHPAVQMASEPSAEDAERMAVTFTNFDMDVRLRSAAQQIAVRALIVVRNDGKTPLAHIPLQISGSGFASMPTTFLSR